jgi:hypothetical protein
MSKRPADETEETTKRQKVEEGTEVATEPAAVPAVVDTTPAMPPAGSVPTPAPPAGGPVPTGDSFVALPTSVQNVFKSAFASNTLTVDDLDTSIYDSLKDFGEPTQLKIANSFLGTDLNSIRNKSGYMIGILKKYRQTGEGMGGAGGAGGMMRVTPGGSAPAASPYGAAYNPYDPAQAYAMMYAAYGMQVPGMPQYGAQAGVMPASAGVAAAFDFCTTESLKIMPQSVKNILNGVFAKGEVSATDIEDSVWDSMKDFDEMTQVQIVERFGQANMSSVRNKTGYLIGILKIFRAKGPAVRAPPANHAYAAAYGGQAAYGAQAAYGGANPYEAYAPQGIVTGSGAFSKLNMASQLRIQELYNSGRARPGEIEDGVFDSLKDFNEHEQSEMVESFCNTDLATIRNKTAFFIGILKRFRQKGGGGF